jgi:hypothetical protein
VKHWPSSSKFIVSACCHRPPGIYTVILASDDEKLAARSLELYVYHNFIVDPQCAAGTRPIRAECGLGGPDYLCVIAPEHG